MTKLNGFRSEIIHICFIYIYNNTKNFLFYIYLHIYNNRKKLFVLYIFIFPSYIGGGGILIFAVVIFVLFLFMCIFRQLFSLFYP